MSQAEGRFSRKVIKKLEAIPKTYVVRIQAGSIVGIHDLIFCCNGMFFSWELKTEEGKPTKLQLHNMEKVLKAGGDSRIVRPSTLEEDLLEAKRIAGVL
jgi:Holliday junction resolvase